MKENIVVLIGRLLRLIEKAGVNNNGVEERT